MSQRAFPVFLLLLILLAGCNYQLSSPARTEVPIYIAPAVGTVSHEPTATITPKPTQTALSPTETAAPTPTVEPPAICEIAPRETYGLNAEDPIAIGNSNLYDGKEREELYLLTLRGPKNEEIFFERQRPMFNQNGEIVDPYLIGTADEPERDTIYFTIYRFEAPLFAPIGYTCEAAFPITDPSN